MNPAQIAALEKLSAGQTPAQMAALERVSARQTPARSIVRRVLIQCGFVMLAVIAYVAHQHFKLQGQSSPALISLVAAGGFALAPLRLVLGELLAIEGMALHLLHGLGGLAFVGLSAGGVITGAPLMRHAALAPFAVMGAAQAIMHQDHPRNAEQAAALQRFASSLPEIEQVMKPGALTSPANVSRAVAVLTDLIGKAQALGETELTVGPRVPERAESSHDTRRPVARPRHDRPGDTEAGYEPCRGKCDPCAASSTGRGAQNARGRQRQLVLRRDRGRRMRRPYQPHDGPARR